MAYIYQKQLMGTASGYDQCLILNTKESILYPLPDELKNWKELRIGFNMTLTSGEDPNARAFADKIIKTNTSYTDSFYFGLKTNNSLLPFQDGCAFIGLGHKTGLAYVSVGRYNNNSNNNTMFNTAPEVNNIPFLMGSGEEYKNYTYTGSAPELNNSITNGYGLFAPLNYMPSSGLAASGAPFAPFCLKIIKQGNTIQMQQARSVNSNAGQQYTTDNSITGLRNFMNQFGLNSSYTYYQQNNKFTYFPFTNDMTSGGYPVPTPDALFIYWPYGNTKLRVHNFCVEKYA